MPIPFWEEFARIQRRVELGFAQAEQLDFLLTRYCDEGHSFDLQDCRRRLKNLSRNLPRKDRRRSALLSRDAFQFGPPPSESPLASAIREESSVALRSAAEDDWEILRDTVDGDYNAVAAELGVAVGTLKSRVSRAKERLRSILEVFSDRVAC